MLGGTATTVSTLASQLDASEEDVLLACYRAGVSAITGQSVLDDAEVARVVAALRAAPEPTRPSMPTALPPDVPLPPLLGPSPRRRRRNAPAWAIAGGVLAAAFVFFATGRTDDGGEDVAAPADPAAACPFFQELRDHADRTQALVRRNPDDFPVAGDAEAGQFLDEYVPFLDAELAQLGQTFDGLAKELPSGLVADVDVVRAYYHWIVAELREARTIAEVEAILADPMSVEGALAGLRLDGYSRATCTISISVVDQPG